MPCCLLAVALVVPRVTLFGMALTGYASRAFQGWLWPVLGFFFMPYTTCAYAIAMNEAGGFRGWTMVLLVVAVVLDLGGHGGVAGSKRRKSK